MKTNKKVQMKTIMQKQSKIFEVNFYGAYQVKVEATPLIDIKKSKDERLIRYFVTIECDGRTAEGLLQLTVIKEKGKTYKRRKQIWYDAHLPKSQGSLPSNLHVLIDFGYDDRFPFSEKGMQCQDSELSKPDVDLFWND